jgi:peptidylprolyl isomerase
MADENTLLLETTQGPVTIKMRPDLAPGHVAASTTASYFTA